MAIIEVNVHNHVDLKEVLKELDLIKSKLSKLMTKQEFKDAIKEITDAVENIANDITTLTDKLEQGGMSDADEQEVFDDLRTLAARAKEIAGRTPEAETPAPETEA
jgi:archaellum component FlaC